MYLPKLHFFFGIFSFYILNVIKDRWDPVGFRDLSEGSVQVKTDFPSYGQEVVFVGVEK